MPTIAQVILQMEQYFRSKQTTQTQLAELRPENFFDSTAYDSQKRALEDRLRSDQRNLEQTLEQFDRFPPRHHMRHQAKLSDLHQAGNYEASVFIMTKFPDKGSPEADRLTQIIETVKKAIKASGYVPRIAQGPKYYRWLWDNVELYLLGCARGVAIVEARYLPELNPNVALEWGWMVGMGREVLFLRESSFKHDRADWAGLLSSSFDWDDYEPAISTAIAEFLPGQR
ncbi:MAG: hypothetical protein JO015_14070 [Verrucomicrobia bacterium]|nr:hypothetical protein [Verrucomicrobiota bacterium]